MLKRPFVGILGLALAGTSLAQDPATDQSAAEAEPASIAATVTPGDPSRGQAKAAVCAACHALDGNSPLSVNPKLAGQHERYIARQLELFATGKRVNVVMVAFAAPLSAQDRRDLGAWYASQQGKPGVASDRPIRAGESETWAQRGERLYRGGDPLRGLPACMACHGAAGSGNPGPAYPRLAGQHADYTKAKLIAYRNGERWGGPDDPTGAIMVQIARYLDDTEIEALATYLEGIHDTTALPGAMTAAAR